MTDANLVFLHINVESLLLYAVHVYFTYCISITYFKAKFLDVSNQKCFENIVYGNLKPDNSQDYAQKPQ
jgi:hypothetical protein